MKLAPCALALIALLAACSRREIETTSVTSPAILAERGADYVACRDALVAGPQEEFDSAIAGLRAHSGSERARALAQALVVRRSEPGKAAVFDGIVQAVHATAGMTPGGDRIPRFDNIVD